MELHQGDHEDLAPLRPDRAEGAASHVPGLLLVCLAGGGVAAFYLALYAVKHFGMPIGYDTPRYLDQASFVAQRGLAHVPRSLPAPATTLAGRTGFPVVLLAFAALFHVSTFQTSAVVPAAMAAAAALAAGAFCSFTLRTGPWRMAAAAGVVGVSPVLIRLMAPETYSDNLMAVALFAGALVPLACYVRDGRAYWAAVILIGCVGLVHEPFFAVVMASLGLTVLALAPASWHRFRQGTPLFRTPAGRLVLAGGGGLALAAAGVFGFLRGAPAAPHLTRTQLRQKLYADVPLYWYPVFGPVAAAGAWLLARARGGAAAARTSRFAARLLIAWAVVTAAGVAAFFLGINSPAHRFMASYLGLPMLVAVAILAAGGYLAARRRRAAGAGLIALCLAGLTVLGYRELYVTLANQRGLEWILDANVDSGVAAAAYLKDAGVPEDAPVVFVLDYRRPGVGSYVPEMIYMLRTVLPPERVQHAYFYLGTPRNFLAGRPTRAAAPPGYDSTSTIFYRSVRPIAALHPVTLVLRAYNPAYDRLARAQPHRVVAPGVIVLRGPLPTAPVRIPPAPTGPRGLVQGAGLGALTLIVLTLIGLGWALALLPEGTRSFEVLAVSPAFGLGFLLLAAILIDGAGVRLVGAGGTAAIVLPLVAGGLAAVIRMRRGAARPPHPA